MDALACVWGGPAACARTNGGVSAPLAIAAAANQPRRTFGRAMRGEVLRAWRAGPAASTDIQSQGLNVMRITSPHPVRKPAYQASGRFVPVER